MIFRYRECHAAFPWRIGRISGHLKDEIRKKEKEGRRRAMGLVTGRNEQSS
jgi:hypothetical protein